jgi:tRNA (mo5U34)-methyltransferase
MSAKPASPFDYVKTWKRWHNELGWWHSFELPDGSLVRGANELAGQKNRIGQFPIPEDLRGRRALDIGTWDGWFAFELERRGADVVAIDTWDNPRFREMHARLNSRVDYRQLDMYELTPANLGRFDIVLFMGVLYHLKHPLLALERVCDLTTDLAAVDSFVLREEFRPGERVDDRPIMEFYENDEMGGQTDNWVGPSVACLLAMCRAAGFARVELRNVLDRSACVACHRHFEPPTSSAAGPELIAAIHNTNHGINFDTRRDDYLSAWFRSNASSLSRDDIKPEVGGYGVRPIDVIRVNDEVWQANFKLPPGLDPGWHDVRVRLGAGQPGSSQRVAVDFPLEAGPIEITGVSDGTTWAPNRLDLSRGHTISLWVRGLPENADRYNVRVTLNGRATEVAYIESPECNPRQINVDVAPDTAAGSSTLDVSAGSARASTSVEVAP